MNADHQPPILDPDELFLIGSVLSLYWFLLLLLLRHAAAAPIF